MTAAEKELRILSRSLLSQVHEDLLCVDDDSNGAFVGRATGEDEGQGARSTRQWLACPRTLRLTTRPRPPLNLDGTRSRTFNRISRSCDMPSLVLDLTKTIEEVSERLVRETLIPMFRKLHPEKSGWNLSLMNLCVTNMSLTAASSKDGAGRDISKMFRRQEHVLKDWNVGDDHKADLTISRQKDSDKSDQQAVDTEPRASTNYGADLDGANGFGKLLKTDKEDDDTWQSDDAASDLDHRCTICGLSMPVFAMAAHERFHNLPD